jgi:hypothetical protein
LNSRPGKAREESGETMEKAFAIVAGRRIYELSFTFALFCDWY